MTIRLPLQRIYQKCETTKKFTENTRHIDRAGVGE